MAEAEKNPKRALPVHRRILKNLKIRVWMGAGFVLAGLAVAWCGYYFGWLWVAFIGALAALSFLITFLADLNAIADRKKTIRDLEQQIAAESAPQKSLRHK